MIVFPYWFVVFLRNFIHRWHTANTIPSNTAHCIFSDIDNRFRINTDGRAKDPQPNQEAVLSTRQRPENARAPVFRLFDSYRRGNDFFIHCRYNGIQT